MTDPELLGRLPLIAATSAQVDRYLRESVGDIRDRRLSYAEIGKALGVSRQAAWERFSRAGDGPHPDTTEATDVRGRRGSDRLPRSAEPRAQHDEAPGRRATGSRRVVESG